MQYGDAGLGWMLVKTNAHRANTTSPVIQWALLVGITCYDYVIRRTGPCGRWPRRHNEDFESLALRIVNMSTPVYSKPWRDMVMARCLYESPRRDLMLGRRGQGVLR